MTGLSYEQGLALLATNTNGLDGLLSIISNMDVGDGAGKITVAYSGQFQNLTAHDVAVDLAVSSDAVRIIDQTPAAQLISSVEFQAILVNELGVQNVDDPLVTEFLYGNGTSSAGTESACNYGDSALNRRCFNFWATFCRF